MAIRPIGNLPNASDLALGAGTFPVGSSKTAVLLDGVAVSLGDADEFRTCLFAIYGVDQAVAGEVLLFCVDDTGDTVLSLVAATDILVDGSAPLGTPAGDDVAVGVDSDGALKIVSGITANTTIVIHRIS
jgi:hypothetical protein